MQAEYRAIAERRVRLGLLLAEIGRANGITVAPDEMTRAMRAEAGRYPGQEAQVMEFFRKNPQAAEGLRGADLRGEGGRLHPRTGPGRPIARSAPEELSVEPERRCPRPRRPRHPTRSRGEAAGTPLGVRLIR